MEISEVVKNSIVMNIELHACCLLIIIFLYFYTKRSFVRNSRKMELSLIFVYIGCALTIISDCVWSTLSGISTVGNTMAYAVNLVYFISSSFASACWYIFCVNELKIPSSKNISFHIMTLTPYVAVLILYIISPWTGAIFTINEGEYVRGNLFFLDPVIKMGYVIVSSLLAFIYGNKKETGYLRKKDYNLILFGAPVLICGVFQTVTGVDFNCLGVTFGLITLFMTGITNPDSENTDAIYSLSKSFEASYIVNMDTGLIRPLHADYLHDRDIPGMESMDYASHFNMVLSGILLPEDKKNTLDAFDIENVAKRFKIDNAFKIRYRVRERSGQTQLHTATFIRAAENEGKQEFLLGINTIHSDSLLYERNKTLSHENERLEQINSSIIESVAKIVEARDGGSGEHIVRVRKLSEVIAREIMNECPELGLDEKGVKLISTASVLHDVGKIVIPDAILLKPGKLTDEEFEIMKTHSAKGCDILNFFPLGLDDAFLECAQSICRWHHEKYDGKGYPDGLKGDDIPIAAQIVSVADCFDALVSERPYKKVYTPDKAFEMIIGGECGSFSPKVLQALENQKARLMELARLYR